MLTNVPLLIVPFIVYNIQIAFGGGIEVWNREIISIPLISGETWAMNMGDLMITLSLILLFFEVIKSTRIGAATIIDHLLSTFVFIAFLVEFLVVPSAAHSVFFILMMIALLDVLAGFSISIRAATRDVNIGHGIGHGDF